jgi:glutamate-1-semialdehyde 2,1-aminomutase
VTSSVPEAAYSRKTGTSARLMERAGKVMPGGSTRTLGWHLPYPLVMDHGSGSRLYDVDGNEYIDFVYNGLSLIHGHSYPPVVDALSDRMPRGTAWPGASIPQIEFAELLCERLRAAEMVRFTNSGTEAAMLAVKLARRHTGRPILVKARHGYHGSAEELEAGVAGLPGIAGRVLLADFGDIHSFTALIDQHGPAIAAVILEPVMYTGIVTVPPDGFLGAVQDAARAAGALFILDDCLMFRLAMGGSQERFGLDPDLIVLGKFIGGGLPVGAVAGRRGIMCAFDPRSAKPLYHGGSFNGSLLGSLAGRIAVSELTAARIRAMDDRADRLRRRITSLARKHGVAFCTVGCGSVFGVYASDEPPTLFAGRPPESRWHQLHLALLSQGIYLGTEGEAALATCVTDADVDEACERFDRAFEMIADSPPA